MPDIDDIIANGHNINQDATPESLTDDEKSKFAISSANSSHYTYKLVISRSNWKAQTIADGAPVFVDGKRIEPSAPAAVWTDGPFLSEDECCSWIKRAEEEGLETGDFIFKQGYGGMERMKTGARRSSATRLVVDAAFTRCMEERLASTLPATLKDGRRLLGLRESFLLSRSGESSRLVASLPLSSSQASTCTMHFHGTMKIIESLRSFHES